MYWRAVDRYCTVPADEYKLFMYVDKIYSNFKTINSKFGLLGKNRVSGDGKYRVW